MKVNEESVKVYNRERREGKEEAEEGRKKGKYEADEEMRKGGGE